jgi:hypothetical protein
MRVSGYGLSVDLPSGWEGRIFRGLAPAAGALSYPVLHAANFAMGADNSTFGQNLIRQMTPDSVLIAAVEYGPEAAGTSLFTSGRWPLFVASTDLNPAAFPGDRPEGLAGLQNFVTVKRRAFCIYLVAGLDGERAPTLPEANSVLSTLKVH